MPAEAGLHPVPLPVRFVEERGGGAGDVEGINVRRHGDVHALVALGEHVGRDAVAFASENDAAIPRKLRVREGAASLMGVRGDGAESLRA